MEKAKIYLLECFSELGDSRVSRTKLHKLEDILVIAICEVICGANDWVNIELFARAKEDWFRQFLKLPNGIPSHDTFGRVFQQLDPGQFETGFICWIQSLQHLTEGEVIAIDGKQLRRSHNNLLGKNAIHMVDAWASSNQLTLGQVKVDEKSNEITAIPKLLELLVIEGAVVTIDAIGCQVEIAEKIVEKLYATTVGTTESNADGVHIRPGEIPRQAGTKKSEAPQLAAG